MTDSLWKVMQRQIKTGEDNTDSEAKELVYAIRKASAMEIVGALSWLIGYAKNVKKVKNIVDMIYTGEKVNGK